MSAPKANWTASSSSPTPETGPTLGPEEWSILIDEAKFTRAEVGVSAKEELFATTFSLPCVWPDPPRPIASLAWSYAIVKDGSVIQTIAAYGSKDGSAIVEIVRSAAASCTKWTRERQNTLADAFSITPPAGVDTWFAYCFAAKYYSGSLKGQVTYYCKIVASLGHLVVGITVFDKSSMVNAQAKLRKRAGLAAVALARAAP